MKIRSANIIISSTGGYQAFLNGNLFGRGFNYTRAQFYQTAFQGSEVLSIIAQPGSDNGALLVDLFLNPERNIDFGVWRCNSMPAPNWQLPSFNDSSWPLATVVGDNALTNPSFRHLPNIREAAQRIWQADPTAPAYCRLIIPSN